MENNQASLPKKSEFILLGLLLCTGLVHGLFYVFTVPPWQHYDEPTHFEVVWLTAKLGRHPTIDDYNPDFSRAVTQSMVDNGFFAGLQYSPDLSDDAKVDIPGYDQFEEQPLYYYLAALPLKVFQPVGVIRELYAARMASVLLYLIAILSAWGIARTLTSPGHALRWLVPTFVVLLPAFTDLMSAVNNDALAVAAFSLFLWGSARLLKTGYTILNFVWVTVSIVLVHFSKNTAYVAFILLPIILVIALLPKTYRRIGWIGVLVLGLTGIALFLKFDDAGSWHRTTSQPDPLRQEDAQAVNGQHILVLEAWRKTNPPWTPPVYQLVPLKISQELHDRAMTIGYWVWANQEVTINAPSLGTPSMQSGETVQVSQTPTFKAFHVTMPPTSTRVWLQIRPNPDKPQDTRLYFDSFVLADGLRPLDEPPDFDDENGQTGTWGGTDFTNYLRNGSIERSWPRVTPELDRLLASILPDRASPSLILNSILDYPATQIMYRQTYRHMMQTFWARFGWGHVPLIWPSLYVILNWIFLLGLLGALVEVLSRIKSPDWDWAVLIFLSAVLIWFANLVRGVGYFTSNDFYIPPSRYAFPSIVPTAILLCFGWLGAAKLIKIGWGLLTRTGNPPADTHASGISTFKKYSPAVLFICVMLFLVVLSLYYNSVYYNNIG